jgi:hypothetical protein
LLTHKLIFHWHWCRVLPVGKHRPNPLTLLLYDLRSTIRVIYWRTTKKYPYISVWKEMSVATQEKFEVIYFLIKKFWFESFNKCAACPDSHISALHVLLVRVVISVHCMCSFHGHLNICPCYHSVTATTYCNMAVVPAFP